MDQSLKSLQTILVTSKADIETACRLSYYYNFIPIYPKDLNKLIKRDWWTGAELLTDVVKTGKYGYEDRRAVSFLLLNEFNFKKGLDTSADLQVTIFAVDQSYDLETSVRWADFRTIQNAESLKRINSIYWPVDERDTPLLLMLSNMGWKSCDYDREQEKVIMRK